jgi:hypothetical protein
MKRLKLSMSVSISPSAISSASVLTLSWRFVFGAVKRDWLLIPALQTTFNEHYFFLCSLGASYKLITIIYSCNDDYHRQKHNKKLYFFLKRVRAF